MKTEQNESNRKREQEKEKNLQKAIITDCKKTETGWFVCVVWSIRSPFFLDSQQKFKRVIRKNGNEYKII